MCAILYYTSYSSGCCRGRLWFSNNWAWAGVRIVSSRPSGRPSRPVHEVGRNADYFDPKAGPLGRISSSPRRTSTHGLALGHRGRAISEPSLHGSVFAKPNVEELRFVRPICERMDGGDSSERASRAMHDRDGEPKGVLDTTLQHRCRNLAAKEHIATLVCTCERPRSQPQQTRMPTPSSVRACLYAVLAADVDAAKQIHCALTHASLVRPIEASSELTASILCS